MHFRDYLEHLKRKPVHERQRIAFGTSALFTALIAFGWITAFLSSDTLAQGAADPTLDDDFAKVSEQTGNSFSELLGAASAFKSVTEGGSLVIVDGSASSTLQETPIEDTRTVIPF